MSDHLRLRRFSSLSEPGHSDQLEVNLSCWLSYALLGAGGFTRLETTASGDYGGELARLWPADDPDYEDGQAWQSARQDWVWETGVVSARTNQLADEQPSRASGVWVDGAFYPRDTSGAYAHHFDYPRGRVVFDSAIPTSSVVRCAHTARRVHVTTADVDWWREVQFGSWRADSPHLAAASGGWAGGPSLQLPCVVVEATPFSSRKGAQLGDGAVEVTQRVDCHVFAETRWDRKMLHDVLTAQWEKRILMFDRARLVSSGRAPLDEDGDVSASGTCYPDWVNSFPYRLMWVDRVEGVAYPDMPPLYHGTVRLYCRADV